MQSASQQLGLKSGILTAYNQNAATHHVYADLKGVKASDRADASGRYFILGAAVNLEYLGVEGAISVFREQYAAVTKLQLVPNEILQEKQCETGHRKNQRFLG